MTRRLVRAPLAVAVMMGVFLGGVRESRAGVRIVGPDETDPTLGWISIDSPLARAALKKRADDEFDVQLPTGPARLLVLDVRYESP